MQKTQTSISEFIESLEADSAKQIEQIHKRISKVMPNEPTVMWEGVFWGGSDQRIIGYGELSYTNSKKEQVEWFMVGLAQQKNYITVFVSATDGKQYITEKYKGKLGKAKIGKSTVSFKSVDDIDLDKLVELLKEAYEVMQHSESQR